jgi:DNA (cytosine-5)-methyltransferase 1
MGRLANTDSNGLQPWKRDNPPAGYGDTTAAAGGDDRQGSTCQNNSIWATPDWLFCRDGKWRPVESGTFPLADGIPGRVGLLRGYGNAIVPQVAAEFITAFMEVE